MRVVSLLEGNADSRNDFHGKGISFLYEFILFERKRIRFFPVTEFCKNSSLCKREERSTFFFTKKKKVAKKKLATLQVDGLSSMEATYRKAHSALRESTMLRHCYYSLGERVFRRSWFFEVLWSYGGFSFSGQQDYFSPKSQFYPHQVWKNNGVVPFESILGAK